VPYLTRPLAPKIKVKGKQTMKEATYYHQRCIASGALVLLISLAAVIGSVDSTTSFRVCFGVLLLMCCVAQLKIAMDLYKHRNDLLLQLFQPVTPVLQLG
jgi:membrane protein YdbS with pleckstrin-like domain